MKTIENSKIFDITLVTTEHPKTATRLPKPLKCYKQFSKYDERKWICFKIIKTEFNKPLIMIKKDQEDFENSK